MLLKHKLLLSLAARGCMSDSIGDEVHNRLLPPSAGAVHAIAACVRDVAARASM